MFSVQPTVTVVGDGLQRVFAQVLVGQRSPWCGEKRTHWWSGHASQGPRCEVAPGVWQKSTVPDATFAGGVDRHGCNAEVDANVDGVPDVICAVGAGRGQGDGENELYLTQANGSLRKVDSADHGLSRFTTMRSRHIAPLRAADGGQLVLITTQGEPRDDGEPNVHRMFRLQPQQPGEPLFRREPGPWEMHFDPDGCVQIADLDGNGLDDLLMCDTGRASGSSGTAKMFTQGEDGSWTSWTSPNMQDCQPGLQRLYLQLAVGNRLRCYWRRSARRCRHRARSWDCVSSLCQGLRRARPAFFDFSQPYFERLLSHAAPDVEVFDANGDDVLDMCE